MSIWSWYVFPSTWNAGLWSTAFPVKVPSAWVVALKENFRFPSSVP